MADGGLYTYTKPQRLNTSTTAQNKKYPCKFYQNYLFKTILFIVFAVITLVLPSEPPDFVSPSAFFTKSWELFHLIFVGIAVSYGLFSRKNDEFEGVSNNNTDNNNVKFDSAHSYMSRLLQVTSAFDDEVIDNSSGSHDDDDDDENSNKMQTWSSQYRRNEPMLVVTENSSVVGNNSGVNGEKPLLLPVRSLKTRVSNEQDGDLVGGEENYEVPRAYTRSNSSPSVAGGSSNSKRSDRSDVSGLVIAEDYRVGKGYSRSNSSQSPKGYLIESKGMSRSGSVKSRVGVSSGEVSRSLSRSNSNLSSRGFSSVSRRQSSGGDGELDEGDMEEHEEKVEETVVLPSPIPWRSRSGRMELKGESDDSSLHLLPPSLEESEAARSLKPQSSRSSRSPPPSPKEPSPPPSMSSPRKQLPSPTVSPESQARGAEDFRSRKSIYSSRLPPPPPPPPPTTRRSRLGKSHSSRDGEEILSSDKELRRRERSVPTDVGWGSRDEFYNSTSAGFHLIPSNRVDCATAGKSLRAIRTGETRTKEVKVPENEVAERKASNYDPMSEAEFSEYPKGTRHFLEQGLLETDDDSETDGENYEAEQLTNTKVEEAPSDVDKKADEFIAKFREQIRLQRIESIKRSTGQLKRTSAR